LGRRGNVAREPLDLNDVVRQYIASEPVQQHAQYAGVGLQVELYPSALGVRGSEGHLMRAASNLLRNALEATASGGSVTLRTDALELRETLHGYETVEPGSYVLLRVTDTGHGMSRDDLTRAFEPFFTKKRYGGGSGSGLGLAIVHAVTKEHEGFIHVESQLGQGTTFTLFFPRIALSQRPPSSAPALRRGGGRVLVVDDEPGQLHTAARTLSALGYEVTTASSAEQARASLHLSNTDGAAVVQGASSGFDLILCDAVLGEQSDGVELLRAVLSAYPGQKTLVMSGYASQELCLAAEALSIPWLSKPYSVQALADAVARVVES
jgi:CheY-like chemotaxis protein